MESMPYSRDLNECSDCGKDYAAELKHKTNQLKETSNQLSPAMECSVNSTDREIRNAFCFKCLQTKGNLKLEGQVNEPDFDVYKSTNCRKIADYLEKDKDDNYFEEYLLTAKVLSKFALLLDIVNRQSERSCCFTKAYGHYAEGTGSVLKMADIDDTQIFSSYRDLADDKKKSELLSVLKFRYFTPREVANLHGFPPEFGFPPSLSVKQQYRLLGNSLNVHVVS